MRCNDCNKFASLEAGEPECDSLAIDNDGNITGSARVVLNCAECGSELKEHNFDVEEAFPNYVGAVSGHCGEKEVEVGTVEAVEETVVRTTGKGRKSSCQAYGMTVEVYLNCECGTHLDTHTFKLLVDSGEMEECQ